MADKTNMNWKPLIAIILSMIMMYITSFSINVLIGPIVQDLEWSVSGLQMVIVSASLIAGTLMVTAGRLGDKIGKKKVFLIGSIIYTIGLTIVVISPNSAIFSIAWAVIWPLGMVMVIPTSVALIMYFYEGTQRATAFGIYGAVLSIVSALAPLIVGFLTNHIGWRWSLALSPAFGILTIIAILGLPETTKDKGIKIDVLSVILSVLAFGLLLVSTTMASTYGWFAEKRPFVIGDIEISLGISIVPILYVVAFSLLIVFFQRGKKLKSKGNSPLLDASILSNGSFTVGMFVQALLYFLVAAVLFTLSVFLMSSAKFDSFSTALATLPISAAVALVAFTTPSLGKKIPPKWIIIAGFIIIGFGTWMISNQATVDMSTFGALTGTLLFGIGCGLVMGQIATMTMIKVAPEQNGEASGLSETLKEIIGQGFAIAFAGSVLFGAVYSEMVVGYAEVEQIELSKAERESIIIELEDTFAEITELEEQKFIANLPEKTKNAYQDIVNSSAELAMQKTYWVLNVFVAIALILSLFLPNLKLE